MCIYINDICKIPDGYFNKIKEHRLVGGKKINKQPIDKPNKN